jgi:hypothetical protein
MNTPRQGPVRLIGEEDMAAGIGKRIHAYRAVTEAAGPILGTSTCLFYDPPFILSATSLHVLTMAGATPDEHQLFDGPTQVSIHSESDLCEEFHELDTYLYSVASTVGFDSDDFLVPIPTQDGYRHEPIIGAGREDALVTGSEVYVVYPDGNEVRVAEKGIVSDITDTLVHVSGLKFAVPGCSGAPLFVWHGEGHSGCCLVGLLRGGTCNLDDPQGIAFIRCSAIRTAYHEKFNSEPRVLTNDAFQRHFPVRAGQ